MNTKLTLKLDSSIINRAKSFANEQNSSLSKLVEGFLRNLPQKDKKKSKSPLVQELSGIIKKHKVPKESDRFEYLMRKYT